jgi:hypothetical protein
MKFTLGRLVATPAALTAFSRNGQSPQEFLARHLSGDWGVVCDEDKYANEEALLIGARLLSAYILSDGTRIWIISEATGRPPACYSPRNIDGASPQEGVYYWLRINL